MESNNPFLWLLLLYLFALFPMHSGKSKLAKNISKVEPQSPSFQWSREGVKGPSIRQLSLNDFFSPYLFSSAVDFRPGFQKSLSVAVENCQF